MSATFPTTSKWSPEQAAALQPARGARLPIEPAGLEPRDRELRGRQHVGQAREVDHVGREIEVLWVKGSGSDLATMGAGRVHRAAAGEILPLVERDEMSDEEMVAYLARCQLNPAMPRASIETLLHAFIPAAHVDHTHPGHDRRDRRRRRRRAPGRGVLRLGGASGFPTSGPGSRCPSSSPRPLPSRPEARFVLLAKHGLVTWGDTPEASYEATLEAVSRAAAFVEEHGEPAGLGGDAAAVALDAAARDELLAAVLPALRGAVSSRRAPDPSAGHAPAVLDFVCVDGRGGSSRRSAPRAPTTSCTRSGVPLWIDFDPSRRRRRAAARAARRGRARLPRAGARLLRGEPAPGRRCRDPEPARRARAGSRHGRGRRTSKAARLSRDLYHRAIAVMAVRRARRLRLAHRCGVVRGGVLAARALQAVARAAAARVRRARSRSSPARPAGSAARPRARCRRSAPASSPPTSTSSASRPSPALGEHAVA